MNVKEKVKKMNFLMELIKERNEAFRTYMLAENLLQRKYEEIENETNK